MKKTIYIILSLTVLFSIIGISAQALPTGQYWFQVGAWSTTIQQGNQFGISVTGASVDIRINSNQHVADPNSALFYWVGLNLPENSFIQVGYEISQANNNPHWFWAYFLHNANAPPPTCESSCPSGEDIGPNGTWYHFSLESTGTTWNALVNDEQIGSVNLGVGNSGGNGPYAVAEAADTRNAYTVLGPVEFQNLAYRDTSGAWHQVEAAQSFCCYGVDSDTYRGNYPYGVTSIPGENNHWIAGSNLENPIQQQGNYLWPWYQVNVEGLPTGWRYPNGWSIYGSYINLSNIPQVLTPQDTSRYFLEGWYVNGVLENEPTSILEVTENMTLKPNYVHQWLVQVNSNIGTPLGAGWYNDGATATISVQPSFVPASGILENFGVGSTLTGWNGNNIPVENGQTKIQVKTSITLTATWRNSYGVLPYLVLPAIGLVLIYLRKKRNTSQPSSEG